MPSLSQEGDFSPERSVPQNLMGSHAPNQAGQHDFVQHQHHLHHMKLVLTKAGTQWGLTLWPAKLLETWEMI